MEFLSQSALPLAAVSFESLISIVYFVLAFSLVIFVHELGHFAVAKFCGIKVLRFSIGMPPRLIGIRIGETDYCIGALPLGGYVQMLGGETGDETEDGAGAAPDDPRAFVNKSVGARAAVLSAGVVMNLIFAFVLFIAIFQHGINSPSNEVGRVLADGAAGRLADKEGPEASLMPGDLILSVNGTEVADFLEIQVETALSDTDKPLEIVVQRDGRTRTLVIPRGAAGKAPALAAGRPLIGFEGARSLTIPPGAPAELPVGWTITGVKGDGVKGDGVKGDGGFEDIDTHVALEERFARNAGRPVTLRLKAPEGDAVREAVVTPRLTVPDDKARTLLGGLLPRIKIRRVEPGSPADAGGLRAGDVVLAVDGNELPNRDGLVKAIHAAGEQPITFRVLRGERTETVVVAPQSRRWERRPTVGIEYGDFDWDHFVVGEVLTTYLINDAALLGLRTGGLPDALADRIALLQGKPFPDRAAFEAALDGLFPEGGLGGHRDFVLGMAERYRAERAGFRAGDVITSFAGETVGGWAELARVVAAKAATVERRPRDVAGRVNGTKFPVAVRRDGREVTLEAEVLPLAYETAHIPVGIGVDFRHKTKEVRAASAYEAVQMGLHKTWYMMAQVYLTLKQMIRGQLGAENLSGPLGIVTMGAKVAQHDSLQMWYMLAAINVNLAVLNFLPIPILDGGHIVFLIAEKIRGKPVPQEVAGWINYVGLMLLLALFLMVTYNDVAKLAK
jgi:regulator of sigma E protease